MTQDRSHQTAIELDQADPLKAFKQRFHHPEVNGNPALYFCGNSLGLQPKSAQQFVEKEMHRWATLGVEGHFKGDPPWLNYHRALSPAAANIVGAKPEEVAVVNLLTVNLHLMMVSFYRPNATRFKVLMEAGAFPSDQYAVESQVKFHGFDPEDAIVEVAPKSGEETLQTEDILKAIEQHGDQLALVLFGGVNYYTGQFFDLAAITKKAHEVSAVAGFDLAHAAGNVPLQLHDWQVDFAVWCTYKYLNSGPGGISGMFVHEKHGDNPNLPRFAGWWGHDEESRFLMEKGFKPMKGADGWQLSNGPILLLAAHQASLAVFEEAGMEILVAKSRKLTAYFESLLEEINREAGKKLLSIITPKNPEERGCQLSLVVEGGREVFEYISREGVIVDWREPDVIRAAPTPLYNTFEETHRFSQILRDALFQVNGLEKK